MLLTILEFAVVTLGVKFLLGLVLIYGLFPADGRCAACDGETFPLQFRRGVRRLARICRLEQRWCVQCGETTLARRGRRAPLPAQPADRPSARRAA